MMQWPKHCNNNSKNENISVSKSIYANGAKFVIKFLLHSAIRLWRIGSQLHTTLGVAAMVFIASRFLQNRVANPYATSFEFRIVLLDWFHKKAREPSLSCYLILNFRWISIFPNGMCVKVNTNC